MKRTIATAPSLARSDLEEDLKWDLSLYLMHREHGTANARDRRRNRFADIGKTAQRLIELLHDDTGEPVLRLGPIPESPTVFLSRIVARAEAKLAPSLLDISLGDALSREIGIDRLSAFEALVGLHLPKTFRKHFGPVTRGRTIRGRARIGEADANSAYVRFAQEQLSKWGITGSGGEPHTAESIIRAMSHAAKGGRRPGKSC